MRSTKLVHIRRVIEHEAVLAVADVIDRAILHADQAGQAAGHALQHRVGAGIVKGGVDEPVSGLIKSVSWLVGGMARTLPVRPSLSIMAR